MRARPLWVDRLEVYFGVHGGASAHMGVFPRHFMGATSWPSMHNGSRMSPRELDKPNGTWSG